MRYVGRKRTYNHFQAKIGHRRGFFSLFMQESSGIIFSLGRNYESCPGNTIPVAYSQVREDNTVVPLPSCSKCILHCL